MDNKRFEYVRVGGKDHDEGRHPGAMKKMGLSERDIFMRKNFYSNLYRRNSIHTLDFLVDIVSHLIFLLILLEPYYIRLCSKAH